MTRNLLLLSVLLFSSLQMTHAAHFGNGEIDYRYIGDSTGTPYEYEIFLTLSSRTPVNRASAYDIDLTSSCFPLQTISLYQSSIRSRPFFYTDTVKCYDTLYHGGTINLYTFRGTVVLPGKCSDFRFSFSRCCRDQALNNIALSLNSKFYIEALLNNSHGPNSSPVFRNLPIKRACVGRNFSHNWGTAEPDGDSLYYFLATPLDAHNQPFSWKAGYSTSQPISTTNGVSFNSQSGQLRFTPNQSEIDLVKVVVEEFRKIPGTQTYFKAGQISREHDVVIYNQCQNFPDSSHLKRLALANQAFSEIVCNTDSIKLSLTQPIECASIAADASDFKIYNNSGSLLSVMAAGVDSCRYDYSYAIWLKLNQSLSTEDTITITATKGTDGNTLNSICGNQMHEGDSISLIVDCSSSVGLPENQTSILHLYPNPAKEILNLVFTQQTSDDSYTEILIFDSNARLIKSIQPDAEKHLEINISNLPAGVYSVQVKSEKEVAVKRFVKF